MQSRAGTSSEYQRKSCSISRGIPSLVIGEAPEPRLPNTKEGNADVGSILHLCHSPFPYQDIYICHRTVDIVSYDFIRVIAYRH